MQKPSARARMRIKIISSFFFIRFGTMKFVFVAVDAVIDLPARSVPRWIMLFPQRGHFIAPSLLSVQGSNGSRFNVPPLFFSPEAGAKGP
jgi:hypothetical protein